MRVKEFAKTIRLLSALVLMGALALTAAGCSGRINPFNKSAHKTVRVSNAPALAVQKLGGLDAARAGQLSAHLRQQAKAQGLPVARGNGGPRDLKMAGSLSSAPVSGGLGVAFAFDVNDPHTGARRRISGTRSFAAEPGAAKPPALTDQMLRVIATDTAAKLAEWIVAQGYELGGGTMPPPQSGFARAPETAPAASGQIYSGPPPGLRGSSTAERKQAAARGYRPVSEPLVTGSIPKHTPAPPEGRPIAVATVTGAGSKGNRALTRAMIRALTAAGVPVARASSNPAHVIAGKVRLAAPSNGMQTISIDWRLKSPSGQLIATISQTNRLPRSALARGWGPTAEQAAREAAKGLLRVWRASR